MAEIELSVKLHVRCAMELGSHVKLTTGGPMMSVRKIDGDHIHCDWIDDNGKPHQRVYLQFQLMVIPLRRDPPKQR